MNKLSSLITFSCLFVVLCLISNASALNCFQCNGICTGSENSTACSVTSMDTCMKLAINYPGGSVTMKSCATSSTCSEQSIGISGLGFYITCCKTNNCNSASLPAPKFMFILGAVLLSFIAFKKVD